MTRPENMGLVDRVAKALMDDAGYTWEYAPEKFRNRFRSPAHIALAAALPEVTSVEELHRLPSGSIVRASGGSAWKKFGSGWGAWFKAGDSLDYEASIVDLPARVLYRPEVKP